MNIVDELKSVLDRVEALESRADRSDVLARDVGPSPSPLSTPEEGQERAHGSRMTATDLENYTDATPATRADLDAMEGKITEAMRAENAGIDGATRFYMNGIEQRILARIDAHAAVLKYWVIDANPRVERTPETNAAYTAALKTLERVQR